MAGWTFLDKLSQEGLILLLFFYIIIIYFSD